MIQEAEYSLTDNAMSGMEARTHGDEHLLVRFFIEAQRSSTLSEEQGRPVFVDREFIQIMQPGNKDSIIIRPASQMDKDRFPEHYRKFKARRAEDAEEVEGTLLSEWPQVTRSQVEEFKFFNIRTVEQLASVSDVNIQNMMGAAALKQKAQQWLEAANVSAAAAEIAKAKAEIAELKAKLDAKEEEYEEDPED